MSRNAGRVAAGGASGVWLRSMGGVLRQESGRGRGGDSQGVREGDDERRCASLCRRRLSNQGGKGGSEPRRTRRRLDQGDAGSRRRRRWIYQGLTMHRI